jgi:hypothetical protein
VLAGIGGHAGRFATASAVEALPTGCQFGKPRIFRANVIFDTDMMGDIDDALGAGDAARPARPARGEPRRRDDQHGRRVVRVLRGFGRHVLRASAESLSESSTAGST